MKQHATVTYHGPCDRAGCLKVTKHDHVPSDPYKADITHRPRLATLSSETGAHGGLFTDTMSVQDLIERLQQCPMDARVTIDENELNIVHGELIATAINGYDPSGENFDAGNRITGVSR